MYSKKNKKEFEIFELTNLIMAYLFIFIDLLTLIICFLFLKTKNKISKELRIKYILIIIINIILRIVFISKFNISSLYKELFSATIISFQFYLILSFILKLLEKILLSDNDTKIEEINIFQFCTIFFFVIISYENFLFSFSKEKICLYRYIIIICCIFKLYRCLRKIINDIKLNSNKNDVKMMRIYFYVQILFNISFILYSIYYFLKIYSLSLDNYLYIIYIKIFLLVIKEGCTYLLFFIFGVIIYTIDKKIILKLNEYN